MGELKKCKHCNGTGEVENYVFGLGNVGEECCACKGTGKVKVKTRIPPATASKGVDVRKIRKIVINNSSANGFDIPKNYKVEVNVTDLATAIKEAIEREDV